MELALDWKPSLALASMEKGVLVLQNPHLSRHLPACSAPQFPPYPPQSSLIIALLQIISRFLLFL